MLLTLAQWIVTIVLGCMAVLPVGIMVLNVFGLIVSGIWLAWLGMWSDLRWGIGLMIVGGLCLAVLLTPSFAFIAAAGVWIERNRHSRIIVPLCVLLGSLCLIAAIALWCLNVLWLFAADASEQTVIPLLLWSYGVAILPIMVIVGEDARHNQESSAGFTAFFINLAYIVAGLRVWWERQLDSGLFWTFAAVMFAGFIFHWLSEYVDREEEKLALEARAYDEWLER